MMLVKNLACFAAVLSLLAGVAGCGGSGDNPRIAVTPRYVPVTVNLAWAAVTEGDSRAVPAPGSARSVVVRITDLSKNPATENDLVTIATINRSTASNAAYNQSYTTSTVVARPNRDTFAEVQFFSEPDGKGTLVASARKKTVLPANGDLGDFDFATGVPQN